ncbi:VOC family protein [Cecembia calidifontis]|jgi:catechol 2,3-dioxygenase-like lactoylglutathione lyase family enzyme|uniref:Catechol 2,3-dioxygenase-like lactoylglutathione lyase family enzyme n=1 Tax=Cecembia calidifontis TaxID=1187080 RepID=A0A4Q7PCI9_9BACT|nr:VOC family protein [Cecembia calidifontis]RZS98083.1 catechol 2,3-dioxygenase-like lactoylglutathione lyase family enzyme [Cecembia calidifontis]
MNFIQIKESCLYLSDLDLAEDFYQGILEMPVISKVPGRHIFFRCGTSVLLCFLPEITKNETTLPPHYAKGKQHIAFEVNKADYLKVKSNLLQKGIIITHEQEWKGGLKSFYFEDPFGHVLEIVPKGIWE